MSSGRVKNLPKDGEGSQTNGLARKQQDNDDEVKKKPKPNQRPGEEGGEERKGWG